ncbi:MAG: hypothetical protein OEW75_10245 [Cyclobacteriaceae bacterium]|nr:hypothetical protein [Cyclobacteriaceae bacterium]
MNKPIFISFMLFLAATFAANAQSPIAEGEKQLNLGVVLSNSGLPLYIGMDFGVHPDISIGPKLVVSYQQSKTDFFGETIIDKTLTYGLIFVFDYHFNNLLEIPSKFDVYSGLDLGYYGYSTTTETPDFFDPTAPPTITKSGGSYMNGNLHVGGRYIFESNLALNLQLGLYRYSAIGASFGITKKF